MAPLHEIARTVGCSERTLRRCVNQGLVRARRSSPRRLALTVSEQEYVLRHWSLLSKLRHALRTEPNVRLAVLFGSAATGDDGPESDVDVLVTLHTGEALAALPVAGRLGQASGRHTQLVRLDDAEQNPSLLADVLEEGRVLVDRDSEWPRLRARRKRILRVALHKEEETARRAREAVALLRSSRP